MVLQHSLIMLIGISVTLGGQDSGFWRIRDAPADVRPVIARADLVLASLDDSVVRELTDTFAQGGADAAIRRVHVDASLVLYRLGREGIAAGRTSDRLRSPTNRPPRWAREMVTKWAGHEAREIDGYAVDLGDRVGVMRPVAERAICGYCHGSLERVSPRVRDTLWEVYPADRALGFRDGEIRGWYWVEMPKPRR